MERSRQRTTDAVIASQAQVTELTIDTHAAFRLRCTCGRRDDRCCVTPPGGDARNERMCSVCAAQLRVLGYAVALTG